MLCQIVIVHMECISALKLMTYHAHHSIAAFNITKNPLSEYHMNPVGFIYTIGRMCSVQQESGAFSSDRTSAAEDSIKTLIALLYSTLFSVYVCIF